MLRCTRRHSAGRLAGIWQESAAEVAKFDEEVVCSDANDELSWKKDSGGEEERSESERRLHSP